MRFACTTSLLLVFAVCASAQLPQQNADGSWSAVGTGNRFNNPMSAMLDTQILRMRPQNALFQNMLMDEMFNEQWRTIGRKVIAEGKASTRLAPLDGAMAQRIVGYQNGDKLPADQREAMVKQLAVDLAIAQKMVEAHHGDPSDIASLLATAMCYGYEQHAGAKTTPAQLKGLTERISKSWLADPIAQGQGAIAMEMTAGKFASAIAAVQRLETDKSDQAPAAGRAMLQSLWSLPVDSIEPTPDGFVDRGERIVAQNKGTATYKPVRSIEDFAQDAVAGVTFSLPLDATDADRAKAQQAWCEAYVSRHREFERSVEQLGLPKDDLAAIGAASVAMLWPAMHEGAAVDRNATRQLFEIFTRDIATDPAFQRMDDAARQKLAINWSTRTTDAAAMIARQAEITPLRKQIDTMPDAMDRLVAGSQVGVIEADVRVGIAKARSLVGELFAPRKLDDVRQRPDGMFEIAPLK